jgi:anti-sigma factor RsiW
VKDRPQAGDDLRCIELVDQVTAYLDGTLDDAERAWIERHLEGCAGCQAAIEQFRTVVRLAGRLDTTDVATLDPLVRDRLTATLRVPRRR